jgi:uncharacterized SAM-binding protein YcdF (DUF218 family)
VTLDAFELKTLVRTLMVPPGGPLLIALAGLLLLRRRPSAGRLLVSVGVVSLWLLSSHAVSGRLLWWVERGQRPLEVAAWQAAKDGVAPPRALVILGGGATSDGSFVPRRERLLGRSVERVLAGARLARATGLPVLVTGGRPEGLEQSEAALMRRVLEDDLAVPVRWVEEASLDTAENASLSAAMLRADGISAVVLVTHAYHMPRARRAFEAAGLAVLPAPHGWAGNRPEQLVLRHFLPSAHALETSWLALHELTGMLWYRLRGLA